MKINSRYLDLKPLSFVKVSLSLFRKNNCSMNVCKVSLNVGDTPLDFQLLSSEFLLPFTRQRTSNHVLEKPVIEAISAGSIVFGLYSDTLSAEIDVFLGKKLNQADFYLIRESKWNSLSFFNTRSSVTSGRVIEKWSSTCDGSIRVPSSNPLGKSLGYQFAQGFLASEEEKENERDKIEFNATDQVENY
ncbi:UNVERIFIED_CONTAM: hypothetical protein NCL1_21397 [Trichonephila clavipes]